MSIAKGMGREYTRISLGGVHEEAEIRGHRMTFIGSMPGNIIKAFCKVGTKNPVFVLDEIDKIGSDFRGDPASALLEVLDPEQNNSFVDHYMDVPLDLSKALFICTANSLKGVHPALIDRMDPVYFSSYTEEAKLEIVKNFLLPKILADAGLTQEGFVPKWQNNDPDEVILSAIRGYTQEAGVRNIERVLLDVVSEIVKEGDLKGQDQANSMVIDKDLIKKIYGNPRDTKGRANGTQIGEAMGLAWTETGGEIMYVQSVIMTHSGKFVFSQTGMLGNVMREADKIALSLLRKWLADINEPNFLDDKLVHLHVPAGAIPKDGPSAGITAYFALESAKRHRPIRPKLAMTGEINLVNMITAVGGIREKVIAAANAGVEELILPKNNKDDFEEDVPEKAKQKFKKVYFVENIDEAREIIFPKKLPA